MPICSRSGSFQAPGPASAKWPTFASKLASIEPKLSWMSVAVRHMFAIDAPYSHGSSPGSGLHIEKTIGRPVALSALLIRVYSVCWTCCSVSPGKSEYGMLQRSYFT